MQVIPERDFNEISLKWGQRFAAYWSIYWPSWPIASIIVFYGTGWIPLEIIYPYSSAIAYLILLVNVFVQVLFVRRMTVKNYRSFWIVIVRNSFLIDRKLRAVDAVTIWRVLAWPQLLLLGLAGSAMWQMKAMGLNERPILSLITPIQLFWIGPLAVRRTAEAHHPNFYLAAYFRERWAKVPPLAELMRQRADL